MKFNRKYNHSTSKNVKNMSSSQASRALLESSTETFNSNSTVSINSSSETQTTNIYDTNNNNNSDIDQDSSLNGKN